jgi:hypothetical protein
MNNMYFSLSGMYTKMTNNNTDEHTRVYGYWFLLHIIVSMAELLHAK